MYPPWFEGEWETEVNFRGFEFPTLPQLTKEQLVADTSVAGFQKLSIAMLVDVGRPKSEYITRFVPDGSGSAAGRAAGVIEDKPFNIRAAIDGVLCPTRGDCAPFVKDVTYDKANPNRISVAFEPQVCLLTAVATTTTTTMITTITTTMITTITATATATTTTTTTTTSTTTTTTTIAQRTRNAERIELFTNSRESQAIELGGGASASPTPGFLTAEGIRQVTYSLSQQFGVARQVVTDYGYYWTHRLDDPNTIRSNLLTCAYLEPQDSLFFKAIDMPVAIYSHDVVFRRRQPEPPAEAS